MAQPSAATGAIAAIGELLRRRTPAATAAALARAEQLVAAAPADPRARIALAETRRAAGQLDAAAAALEAAIRLGFTAPELSFNLGALSAELGRRDAAMAWYRDALRQRPQYPAALANLGELLHGAGRAAEAEAAYAQALALDAGNRTARHNLALLCRDQGRTLAETGAVDAARAAYGRALALDPADVRAALGLHLALPPVAASAAAVAVARERYAAGLDALAATQAVAAPGLAADVALGRVQWCNFLLAYQGGDDRALQARYGDWLARHVDSIDPALRAPLPAAPVGARIRVGFASRFFSRTTVGSYFGRWVTGLDRRRFEVVVFDFAPAQDDIAAAIAARADVRHVLSPREHSLAAIAGAIRAARLDVLVYPELGMHDVAYTLAALRLAPVQCCGWGHPVTTGHPTIDWFVSAAAMEPDGAAAGYRERLVGLPGLGACYPRPPQPARARRGDFGLPEGRTLLACPQSLFKIHPDNDALFADVLAAAPQADLVLFEVEPTQVTETFRHRLAAVLAARGIDAAARVHVLPVVPRERYLALTSTCDLVLDTLHWSGGNTSLDAIACGLPLVTLPGRFMRGRQSAAMLRQIGLPQLVAADRDGYLRLAVELATQPSVRADVAREVARRGAALFDDPAPLAAWAQFLEAVADGGDAGALRLG